jgi:hypothetical protein
VRRFVIKIFRTLFLTRDSPASLQDGSGCCIGMIRISVLGLQASHLLLIRTNLGYGTVLTAACARQGCSATYHHHHHRHHHSIGNSISGWQPNDSVDGCTSSTKYTVLFVTEKCAFVSFCCVIKVQEFQSQVTSRCGSECNCYL